MRSSAPSTSAPASSGRPRSLRSIPSSPLSRPTGTSSADEPHGNRRRKTHRLTDKGRAALGNWLRSERVPDFEQREEGLLRLFFADALPLEEALELVRRLRARAKQIDTHFQAEILPLAQRAASHFPMLVAREGADYFS